MKKPPDSEAHRDGKLRQQKSGAENGAWSKNAHKIPKRFYEWTKALGKNVNASVAMVKN